MASFKVRLIVISIMMLGATIFMGFVAGFQYIHYIFLGALGVGAVMLYLSSDQVARQHRDDQIRRREQEDERDRARNIARGEEEGRIEARDSERRRNESDRQFRQMGENFRKNIRE